jgi:hypothetical protein
MSNLRDETSSGGGIGRRAFLRATAVALPFTYALDGPSGMGRVSRAAEERTPGGLILREKEPQNLETPPATLTDFLTPAERFFVRNHFPVPRLDLNRSEGLGGDQCLHVPVQVAAIGQAHFQPVQAALPLLHPGLRAEAVFEEQEPTARLEDSIHLAEGLAHVLDAAQGKGADHAVEGVVPEGEPFAAQQPLVNLDARLLDPPLC